MTKGGHTVENSAALKKKEATPGSAIHTPARQDTAGEDQDCEEQP